MEQLIAAWNAVEAITSDIAEYWAHLRKIAYHHRFSAMCESARPDSDLFDTPSRQSLAPLLARFTEEFVCAYEHVDYLMNIVGALPDNDKNNLLLLEGAQMRATMMYNWLLYAVSACFALELRC